MTSAVYNVPLPRGCNVTMAVMTNGAVGRVAGRGRKPGPKAPVHTNFSRGTISR
jgi:hypothetical protein